MKRNETVDQGHGTFPAKNERFTVTSSLKSRQIRDTFGILAVGKQFADFNCSFE